jgi:hypothetical protein
MDPEAAPTSPEAADDILGWYRATTSAEPLRVRAVVVDWRTLELLTFSGRLIARWSLERLVNRGVPVLGETWAIGDSQLPEPVLELENDRDYLTIRGVCPRLRPLRTRWWHLLWFSLVGSGWGGVLVVIFGSMGIYWLWQNLPFTQCIATHPDGILFLRCLLFDHFML